MENQQHIANSNPIHISRESAEFSITQSIAIQAGVTFEFAKYKIVMMYHIAMCNCNESIAAVRGVSMISNRPYAMIRRYCKFCGTINCITEWPKEKRIALNQEK